MKKSYILKFDKVQGDYVIVEQETQPSQCQIQEVESVNGGKRNFFFGRFFKNNTKSGQKSQNFNKNQEIVSERKGFLNALDNQILKKKQEKTVLSEGLNKIDKVEVFNENTEIVQPSDPPQARIVPDRSNNNLADDPTLNSDNQTPSESNEPAAPIPTPVNPTPNDSIELPEQNGNENNTNNISVAEGIQLIAQLYGNFRILNMIYQNLRDINQSNAELFRNMISENIALQGSLLNVFYQLSEQTLPPCLRENMPILSSDYLEIVGQAASRVQGMRDINLRLSRMFDIENFNRIFNLIESALAVQSGNLTEIRLNS